MGTRSGDLDPAVVAPPASRAGLDVDEIDERAQHAQRAARARGRQRPARGAPAGRGRRRGAPRWRSTSTATASASTSAPTRPCSARVDAIVFTAGVGENDAVVRARSLARPRARSASPSTPSATPRARGRRASISPDGARVAVLVVPTDEELEMATQAAGAGRGLRLTRRAPPRSASRSSPPPGHVQSRMSGMSSPTSRV